MIKIDPEFKELLPPLSEEERAGLEADIIRDGCLDALKVWKEESVLVDGHNRFEICQRHGVKYKVVEKSFNSRGSAMMWMVTSQANRRNWNAYTRTAIALKLAPILEDEAKERMLAGKKIDPVAISPQGDTGKTRDKIAEIAKVGGKTVDAVRKIEKKATPKQKSQLISGETTINAVSKEIKKAEREERRKKEREELKEVAKEVDIDKRFYAELGDIRTFKTSERFDFIITDPPYLKEYLDLYEVLAKRSGEFLADGGLLITMAGQSYLNKIYEMMSKHMDYYWTAAYLTPGQPTPLRQRNVNSTWKPLLIFTKKGDKYKGRIFGDVFTSEKNEKDLHEWGQSESGMYDIISKICLPGQRIFDPFCGAGTTGAAAKKHGCLFFGIDNDQDRVDISNGRILYDGKEKI